MEKLSLGALAQYFSDNGPHYELAGTISDLSRAEGDEYCPFCLGTHGQKSLMTPVEIPPEVYSAASDYYKCKRCKTIFGRDEQQLWLVTEI
jgi:hypothetical protein